MNDDFGRQDGPVLITGGAGFIGTNAAAHFLEQGRDVLLLDNFSRAGVTSNFDWLVDTYGNQVQLVRGTVCDGPLVEAAVRDAGAVLHLAAQVAVTTSLVSPVEDFEVNARGTLNVVEALRVKREQTGITTPLLFTSTNKVYGGLGDVDMIASGSRYRPARMEMAEYGVSEKRPLDFHSPYGCSKGAADQYVLDYARTFDLPFAVFRMSCIYGPHQCGNEDQGWLAHFVKQTLAGEEVTLFGDGRQVRDVLFVEDLVKAFELTFQFMPELAGKAFNMGGGPENAVSLLEVLDAIEKIGGHKAAVSWGDWRPGDQRYYVSDTRAFQQATGWRAQVSSRTGISRLYRWMSQGQDSEQLLEAAVA